MEYHYIIIDVIKSGDREAGLVLARIAPGCHDHADAGFLAPFHIDIGEFVVDHCHHDVHQVRLQTGQDYLRLGVAETGVEFDYLGHMIGNHQAAVEDAFVCPSFVRQGEYGRFHDGLDDDVPQRLAVKRGRTVAAHAPCIRALVIVVDALVVAGGHGRDDRLAVREGEIAHLPAVEVLLDDHPVARRPERLGFHDGGQRFLCLEDGLRDDNALAGGKPVGFDDYRWVLLAGVCLCLFQVGKAGATGAGDAVPLHEFLGEDLAGLYLGGALAGAEDGQAIGKECIGDARGEGTFRADDGKVDAFPLGEFQQRLDIFSFDIHVLRQFCRPGVPGCGIYFLDTGTLCQLPDDGMLSSAAANYQYLQFVPPYSFFNVSLYAIYQ